MSVLPNMVKDAMNSSSIIANPRTSTSDDVEKLFLKLFE
jgi:alcohol dehydrogenase class IV